MLVYGDTEHAGILEVADVNNKCHISIPHVLGIGILICFIKDRAKVEGVSDGGVSKGRQRRITLVDRNSEVIVIHFKGPSGRNDKSVSDVDQYPEVFRHCWEEEREKLLYCHRHVYEVN